MPPCCTRSIRLGRATKEARTPPNVGSKPKAIFSSDGSNSSEVLPVNLLPSGCLGISVTFLVSGE